MKNDFRSPVRLRVRIALALALKGLPYDNVPVHLPGGEYLQADYAGIAAEQQGPLLGLDDGTRLSPSMAIIEYLDETHPGPVRVSRDVIWRARVRALGQPIACL